MLRLGLITVVLVGCGAPRLPGAPVLNSACTTEKPECATADTIAICAGGAWREWGCVGRCSNEQSPKCVEEKAAKPGDACPYWWADGGAIACLVVDGGVTTSILKCVQSKAEASDCGHYCDDQSFPGLIKCG